MRNERRKNYRLKSRLSVVRCSLKYLFETNSLSRDISEYGICLLTENKIEIGEVVELGIYVPESKTPIMAKGEVVRRNETNDPKLPFLLGIKFIDIESSDREKILEHIRFYLLKG